MSHPYFVVDIPANIPQNFHLEKEGIQIYHLRKFNLGGVVLCVTFWSPSSRKLFADAQDPNRASL